MQVTHQQAGAWVGGVGEPFGAQLTVRFGSAVRWLVDSHLWVAGAAASLTLFAAHFLGLPPEPRPVLLVFAATLIIYSADAYFDGLRWPHSATRVTANAAGACRITVIAALAVIGWALWEASPATVVPLTIGGALCLAYGAPVLPAASFPAQRRRLKDIPGFKAPFVSAAITGAVIATPLLYGAPGVNSTVQAATPASVAFLASSLFGVILCNVYFFDIRDRHADARSDVRTLPLLVGVRRTRQFCGGIIGLLLALWLAAPAPGAATIGPLTALLLAILATLVYVLRLSADASRLRFAVVIDGVPYLLLVASLVLDVQWLPL